jgi:tetratricopeptide (TPR) repeat protein
LALSSHQLIALWLQLWLVASQLFQELEQYDDALACVEQAQPLTPHQASIDVARADVYAASGDLDQAVLLYEQALILDPEHVASLVGLGRIQVQKEENDMALNRLCTALQHDPTHHQVCQASGMFCPPAHGSWLFC